MPRSFIISPLTKETEILPTLVEKSSHSIDSSPLCFDSSAIFPTIHPHYIFISFLYNIYFSPKTCICFFTFPELFIFYARDGRKNQKKIPPTPKNKKFHFLFIYSWIQLLLYTAVQGVMRKMETRIRELGPLEKIKHNKKYSRLNRLWARGRSDHSIHGAHFLCWVVISTPNVSVFFFHYESSTGYIVYSVCVHTQSDVRRVVNAEKNKNKTHDGGRLKNAHKCQVLLSAGSCTLI